MELRRNIYMLRPILDDPRYEGFGGANYPNSLPRNWIDTHPYDWRVIRLRSKWLPIEVRGRVRKFNDYPTVNGSNPAFSERAVNALRDFLEPNGEILPLSSPLGSYFAFNMTTIADVLDLKRSKVQWTVKGILAFDIERYELSANKMKGLSVFQLRQLPGQVHVTEPFVARAREHGLRGMNFIKVWPMPPGVSWRVLEKERRKKRLTDDLPPGQTIKGNTVVIRLMLANPRSKGTAAEKKAVDRFMDQLDALLVDVTSDAPAIGSLEGSDYGVPGECRLFLSCPDADRLVSKLRPPLTKLNWPHELKLLKRYGNFADVAAREQEVDLQHSREGMSS